MALLLLGAIKEADVFGYLGSRWEWNRIRAMSDTRVGGFLTLELEGYEK
ncbi:MAG: hypothetical protein ACC658_16820 [Acidimicrobiia bacterium]